MQNTYYILMLKYIIWSTVEKLLYRKIDMTFKNVLIVRLFENYLLRIDVKILIWNTVGKLLYRKIDWKYCL